MTSKTIRVDFYKVTVSGEWSEFEGFLRHVASSMSHREQAFKINKSSVIRLREIHFDSDFCSGDMVKIKMDDLPTKSSISSNYDENIQLGVDEGIGTGTAFLYHLPSKILLIQSVSSGVSVSNFSKYFMSQYPSGKSSVVLYPIIRQDALKIVEGMIRIRSFDIKFANIDRKESIPNSEDFSVESAIDLATYYDAPSVEVQIGVGRDKSRNLLMDNVRKTFDWILKMKNKGEINVSKARITGVDEDSVTKVIDLLECTIREEIKVSCPERTVEFWRRKNALHMAWDKRKEELKAMHYSV
jgi:hypothetical protein